MLPFSASSTYLPRERSETEILKPKSQESTAPQGVAPDGIGTAKETQHQPNSTAEKGDIFNEVRKGTFSKSFDKRKKELDIAGGAMLHGRPIRASYTLTNFGAKCTGYPDFTVATGIFAGGSATTSGLEI